MKIIAFKDGLGNQLFQYRLYSYFKSKSPKERIYGYYNKKWLKAHNGLEIFDKFDIEKPKSTHFSNFIVLLLRIIDKFIHVIARDNSFRENAILYIGYWQDKHFWNDNMSPLPMQSIHLNSVNENVLNLIKKTQSVFIHVRRGDYLKPENSIYNICNIEYYIKAINIMNKKISSPYYFIFSDDIEWSRENLWEPGMKIIEHNKDKEDYEDIFLMSKCAHHIIANSSFSWWGAWLGTNEDKIVIAPEKWFQNHKISDAICEGWICMKST